MYRQKKHVTVAPALARMVFLAGALGAAVATAQTYPSRTIRLVVPFSPGGASDTAARIIGQKLSERWGQQVVVENRPGAGGTIGTELAARAQPDGYTLLMGSSTELAVNPNLYPKLAYDTTRDFAPVALIASTPLLLVTHPSLPARSVKELVALAKSHKEPMLYASSGNGSIHHITMEAFKAATRVDMTHVPYRGAGQSVPAMMSGEVMVAFLGYPAMSGAIKSGRLRVLGYSLARRSTLTPDVPTVAETVAPGFDMAAPLGVFVAAGTRREIVTRLSQSVNDAVRNPDVVTRMAAIGMVPVGLTPEQYEKNLREEHERLGVLIRRIGMRLD